MLRTMFDSTTIPVLQETIRFAQARHEILAGNVANMDVPGYQVRDLSVDAFQKKLRDALELRREQATSEVSPGILNTETDDPLREVRDSMKSILYHDKSNVGLEQQVAELSKNQFLHNLSISVLGSQFRILQAAVTERV